MVRVNKPLCIKLAQHWQGQWALRMQQWRQAKFAQQEQLAAQHYSQLLLAADLHIQFKKLACGAVIFD